MCYEVLPVCQGQGKGCLGIGDIKVNLRPESTFEPEIVNLCSQCYQRAKPVLQRGFCEYGEQCSNYKIEGYRFCYEHLSQRVTAFTQRDEARRQKEVESAKALDVKQVEVNELSSTKNRNESESKWFLLLKAIVILLLFILLMVSI
jgi:hypothetical protein